MLALSLLVAVSIAGALIPQRVPEQAYVQTYGQGWARLLIGTGATDIFGSPLFLALAGYLVMAMLVCSLTEIPEVMRSLIPSPPPADPGQYEQAPYLADLRCCPTQDRSVQSIADHLVRELRARRYRNLIVQRDEQGLRLSMSKGWPGRLGPLLVHVSLIAVAAGGAWTAVARYSHPLTVTVGETSEIPGTPYTARLEDFNIEYYEGTDRPKEYISDLTLLVGGRVAACGQIKVNRPLKLGGYGFYQMTFGATARRVTVAVTDRSTGRSAGQFTLPLNRDVPIEPLGVTLRASKFLPDFALTSDRVAVSRTQQYANPAAYLEVYSSDQPTEGRWMFSDMPEFGHAKSPGRYKYKMTGYERALFSGLKVVREPALPLVYGGFVVLTVGTFLSCYVFHRRMWAMVRPEHGQLVLRVCAQSHRNMLDLRRELDACIALLVPLPGDAAP